ncbi:MAG: hypothetical protein J0H98_01870 [Solirubrobacterales bacterium]|nr:hypothetical protein [Solirubrobacterales bacterium]
MGDTTNDFVANASDKKLNSRDEGYSQTFEHELLSVTGEGDQHLLLTEAEILVLL